MAAFRILPFLNLAVLVVYTGIAMANHGAGLLPIFFGDMIKMVWPGQFNLGSMFMLTLSALWTAWRHRFSGIGFVLACPAFFGGCLFLTAYL